MEELLEQIEESTQDIKSLKELENLKAFYKVKTKDLDFPFVFEKILEKYPDNTHKQSKNMYRRIITSIDFGNEELLRNARDKTVPFSISTIKYNYVKSLFDNGLIQM